MVACLVGIYFYESPVEVHSIPGKAWFPGTVFLGVLFIVVFNLMAITSQRMGVSVASVATKMSLVIPVVVGIIVYDEHLSALKITGIFMALAAVYFSSVRESKLKLERDDIVFPLLVFLGSGIIDASIKFLEETSVPQHEFPLFSATIFATASSVGIAFTLIKSVKSHLRINYRNVLGGIALGVPNFFSIYFLLKALQNEVLNSASLFTVNNVAIVMLSTLLGILFFREKVGILNWVGIGMAVISIILVAYL
jgi:drug/metabolite transporter (DMT)-like permease